MSYITGIPPTATGVLYARRTPNAESEKTKPASRMQLINSAGLKLQNAKSLVKKNKIK